MTTPPRILIAGIGNIFLGDDAFGVHVAQLLLQRNSPASVQVKDFGIRGLDLAYALVDTCDIAILIDAVPRGKPRGTLSIIEPNIPDSPPAIEGHSMDPVKVLGFARSMTEELPRCLILACEPAPIDEQLDMQSDLSDEVRAAIDPAARLAESLALQLLSNPAATEFHCPEEIQLQRPETHRKL